MISYLKGAITYKSPTNIIVETAGVGYEVLISLHTYAQIEPLEQVKILTYHYIKEDQQTLYGFADDSERKLFGQLISVSGVGPSTAQVLLSTLAPDEVRGAILAEDELAFKRVKGVGPKTAKRIILDLKDKIAKDAGDAQIPVLPKDNTIRQEALSALLALGFSRVPVQKTLNQLLKERPSIDSVEQLIKLALQQLS
ncbi:MAG: Holliday junction branch migration protein RuvA [Saprospiraceae bacterium]|nr:Holliday junction branch migration protein RuvA [Saprospiraceae bacterium]MCB0625323.1 Holliday junction branch migration protein RuvA [Saprospiraceae bacterium]MCB0676507.1 Holliday junction branch migration protein RuvA [Saprospiraceae bacterium]MCB0679852.1 Holliday junction branch migration protein RuvA [Saprospiraceae bacterium]